MSEPTTEAGHVPTPTDICSTCGRGLVHVIPSLDPVEARASQPLALDVVTNAILDYRGPDVHLPIHSSAATILRDTAESLAVHLVDALAEARASQPLTLDVAARQVEQSRYAISHGAVGGPSERVASAALDALRSAASQPLTLDAERLAGILVDHFAYHTNSHHGRACAALISATYAGAP